MKLLSVNVGLPKDVTWHGQTVHTGIWKQPVDGPRMVRRLNVDGDGQGDRNGHGGEQRAVHRLPDRVLPALAVSTSAATTSARASSGRTSPSTACRDDEVCIGDRYRIGDAEFEVTQPRVTCYRVGLRLGRAADARSCWSRTTGPASTSGCCAEGLRRGG